MCRSCADFWIFQPFDNMVKAVLVSQSTDDYRLNNKNRTSAHLGFMDCLCALGKIVLSAHLDTFRTLDNKSNDTFRRIRHP